MRAIGYVRVSTVGQAEEGLGLEVQASKVAAYCSEHGLELVSVFSDEGKSGKDDLSKRLGLAEALGSMGRDDVLVVARLDRLARDLILQETLIGEIARKGGQVASCDPGEASMVNGTTDDPSRRMVRQIFGAIGEYERAVIAGRLAAARRIKRQKGGYSGGYRRWEKKIVGTGRDAKLEDNPEAKLVVDDIIVMTGMGMSSRQIAHQLNERGIPGPSGGEWNHTTVWRIIHRAA